VTNAPYDGERNWAAEDQFPPQPEQRPAAPDPYLQDTYAHDPHRQQDPTEQDPVGEALYDRAAHPPPAPYAQPYTQPYAQPYAQPYQGYPQYGQQQPQQQQYVGLDELVSHASAQEQPGQDPYEHLFRNQQPQQPTAYAPADPGPEPEEAVPAAAVPSARSGGRATSLLKSSAVMAAGTIVSRVTGFGRNLVVAAAIGIGTLNDSYQVANVLPTMIYILVGGGALNAVFIPQLVRAMKNDEDGGEAYANRLLTLVVVLLAGVTTVTVLAAPLLIRMMSAKTDPVSQDVAVTFARYCLPTMFFMGVHVVLGQILNARGRFGAMMWTPVLNNIVIIATFGSFIWVYGTAQASGISTSAITPEGLRLLGIGTLLGLTVQALAMIPYLRETGFRLRPRFDWRGHGLGHAAKLAKWTFFFVLANQLGMIVVTNLATWAGSIADKQGHQGTGITAYNYALQLWQMPQAIITVSVMTAVLPRISRAAADGDSAAVRDDLSYGLRTSAVAIVPAAFAFLALGIPLSTLMYASSGEAGAQNIGFTLMAFALGLIPYSVCYVVLRGFYAYEDTRTPFYNTVIVALVNAAASAACFVALPARWAVTGMAASYGLAYVVGVGVAVKRLRKRLGGDLDGKRIVRTYTRLIGASIPAALVGGTVAYGVTHSLGYGAFGSLLAVMAGGLALLGVFFVAAKRMRIEEMTAMVGMVRGRLGR
jgi:putative peptidoglycan lipid II flippase